MRSTKFAGVPRATTSVPAPRISFKLRSLLLFQVLAPLGFFLGEVHATPLLDGSYFVDVDASFGAGLQYDVKSVTNQPIVSQTTSFSAGIDSGFSNAASALTLAILNDDGSGHSRINAITAGNYFRNSDGPSYEADGSFGLSFSVLEPVVYSITGRFLFDVEGPPPRGLLQGSWATSLKAVHSSTDLYRETEGVQGPGASALHLDLLNEGTITYTGKGSLTGTLLPGQVYSLYYSTTLFSDGGVGNSFGVSSSTFSIDFVKAPETDPIDPPPTNPVP